MIKRKLSIATAAALFFVLAGTGVASALWSTPASVSSTVKVANLADDCSTTAVSMLNASFEDPAQSSGVSNVSGNGGLTGWRAKKNSDNSVTSIEVWTSGTQYDNRPPVIAPVGNQFVELNANEAGTLYQDVDTLTAGQMLQWSFLHRGRLGEDTMQLLIGAPGALVLQGQFKTGNNVANGNNGWVRYSGSYIVPANQSKTQLAFKALETANGNTTIGNFLDDVSFGSSPCVKASSTVNNATPATSDTIRYSTVVASSGGTPSSATAFSWGIPAGLSYVANTLRVNNAVVGSATGGVTSAGRIFVGLGVGATSTAGGTLARGVSATVTFDVVVNAPSATTFGYSPNITYTNGLAAGWTRTVVAANVPITVSADRVAPSKPGTPTASGTTATRTTLTWAASSDNVGVAGYDIYRNGTVLQYLAAPAGATVTFTDTTMAAGNTYTYTIRAKDAAGNISDASDSRSVFVAPAGFSYTAEYRFTPTTNTNYCLSSGTNGAVGFASGWTCNGGNDVDWMFTNSDGFMTIKQGTDRYLTATGTSTLSTAPSAGNVRTQQWSITSSGTEATFESRNLPGLCLTRNGTTVLLAACGAGQSQVWSVYPR